MSFIGNLFKKHAENAVTSVQQFLVTLDPETATEAQIAEFSDQLRKASEELASARAEYQKDQKEADEMAALYDKRLQAATILEQQIAENRRSGSERIPFGQPRKNGYHARANEARRGSQPPGS